MLFRTFISFFLLCTHVGYCDQVEQLREKISELGSEHHFTFVDLGFSKDDLKDFEQFNLLENGDYSRFGDLPLLKEELPIFLRSLGTNDEALIQKITDTIYQISVNVAKAAGKETAWMTVRAVLPNPSFDIPRWHCDGPFYFPYNDMQFKFATVLKGNPTLFYQLSPDLRQVLYSYEQNVEYHFDLTQRETFNCLLDKAQIQSPQKGQVDFLSWAIWTTPLRIPNPR